MRDNSMDAVFDEPGFSRLILSEMTSHLRRHSINPSNTTINFFALFGSRPWCQT
jgi:hypothetical protein